MTSEVAVLTKHAVALAADSAVTSGGKIFNTVDKVFALSKHEPVGIMVYSSADVMGVPVDTVIKEFRRQEGRRNSEDLAGYATRFEEFLKSNDALFPEDARKRALLQLVQMFVDELQARADANLKRRMRRGLRINKTNMIRALSDAVTDIARKTRAASRVKINGPVRALRSIISDAISEQSKAAIQEFGRRWPISHTMRNKISRLTLEHLFRKVGFGGETGFAFAGFGTKDIFPRVSAFEFYCSALGLHKVNHLGQIAITDDFAAEIVPFAQRDVVDTFIKGIDPIYSTFLEYFVKTFFGEKKAQLLDGDNPENQDAAFVEALGTEFGTALRDELARMMDKQFVQPTLDVVAMMPKDELAALAEALVNITALKRKASRQAETVGGPTDVAVISKGDGFVWVRRKHYFDPGLNPGFMKRYLEE